MKRKKINFESDAELFSNDGDEDGMDGNIND